jgi:hypothetical protein
MECEIDHPNFDLNFDFEVSSTAAVFCRAVES